MRRFQTSAIALLIFWGGLCGAASEYVHAQEFVQGVPLETRPPHTVAVKVDEYGKIGHCDMTARLDNLAVALQNEPGAKAFLIAFDPQVKKYEFAEGNLRVARHYLVHARGIESGRVVTIHGGQREMKDGLIELWIVPENAVPPVVPPATDKYADANFSGKFDVYSTDEQIYMYVVEMGYSSEDIARTEFAEKLKQQPETVGYLVIRAAKDGAPGAWRRIGRRDEQILEKHYGVETGRLKTIDGGQSEGDYARVELWILPKSEPPPAGMTENTERKLDAAFRLNTFDTYGSEEDEEATRWMLENLAELLRENPRASAYLVAREPAEPEVIEGEEEAEASLMDEGEAVEEQSADSEAQEGEASDEGDESEESETAGSMKDLAEEWKQALTKLGIEAHRIVVLEGRRMPWSVGRLTMWVVPENAKPPDPSARDKDEPEEEDSQESEGGGAVNAPDPPKPQSLDRALRA